MSTHSTLARSSLDQLIAAYAAIGIEQYELTQIDEVPRYNRLFKKRRNISAELRRRGPAAMRALLPLLSHPNLQVILMAAQDLMDLEPARCRAAFEYVKASQIMSQAANASLSLDIMDGKIGPFV